MAVCRIYDVSGATLEQYDRVNEDVGPEKPDGAMCHIAGATDNGIMVIEVWESPEHIERYMQSGLGDALGAAGVPEPKITELEVHNFDWA